MTFQKIKQLLEKTYGQHLDHVYVPTLGRNVLFKPITTAHAKLLTRSQFIDEFQLPVQLMKLSLFDTLCAEDLKSQNITSKTITTFDYLAFLIGIRSMLELDLKFKFKCKCSPDKQFEKQLDLAELFDDIISEYKPQHEVFEKVDEKTNLIYKFQLANYSMLDFLYYKHIIYKLKGTTQNDPDIINNDKFIRPLLYIKNLYINDQPIDNWDSLLLTDKVKLFNQISPKITLLDKENETLLSFIHKTFYQEKLFQFIKNIEVECPQCHKKYRRVYDFDNFFMF